MSLRDPYSISLDRINSNTGYIRENVVFCCWIVNAGKNMFPLETYIDVCKKVANNFYLNK